MVVIMCAVRVLVRSLEMVDTSDFKCLLMSLFDVSCLLLFFFFVKPIKKKIKIGLKENFFFWRKCARFCHGQTSTSTS